MFSKELLQGVLKEMKRVPRHAKNVVRSSTHVLPHEKYSYGRHRHQYVCYFEPKEIGPTRPVIVFIHGGSWLVGKPEMFTDRARVFVQQGYPVIMPTHRKLPFHWYPVIREDLVLILQKVQEVLVKQGLTDRKIILGGMSSGGNLAALSFFDPGIMRDARFSPDRVVGGLFCAAPLNLAGMPDSIVLRAFAGERTSNIFHWASPITHLEKTHSKPLMIVHGEEDGLVAYKSTVAFVKQLEAITQCPLTFHTIPNGSHIDSVRWVGPDSTVRKVILDWVGQFG